MISRNFIKSSFIYTIAGALPMASAILLLPFYITMLPTTVYGALSLYLAFSLFVQVVVAYSFDSSLYIHYHEFKNDQPKLASFVSSAFLMMLMIGAGVGLVLTVVGEVAFTLIFKDEKISFYPFGLMSVAVGIFQALFKVYSNLLQSREKPEVFLWSNLLLFAMIAGLTIAGLYIFPNTLAGPVGGRMVAGLVASLWVLYSIFKEYGVHFNFSLLRSTFHFNNYTFIYQLQQWVINYFDRFLMLFFLPLSDVGIYDFAIKCLVVIEYVMTGLYNSFYPKVVSTIMAQEEKRSTVELNRYYHGLTAVVMLMISAGILVLPFLVELFQSDKGYDAAIPYFPFIAVLYLLRTIRIYFASPYGVLKFTKPLPIYYLIVSVIKISLLFVLIKSYGIYGVVAATFVSSIAELFLLRYGIADKFQFQFNYWKILVAPLIVLLAVLVLEPLMGQSSPVVVHSSYVVIVLIFLGWTYRNELPLLYSKFLK